MKYLILVFIGGGLGSSLRYYFSATINSNTIQWLPTIAVNLLGCLALGFVFGAFEKQDFPQSWYLLLGTGFCGGLTTFSTFSLEVFNLMKQQDYMGMLSYLLISILGGLLFVFLGLWFSKVF
ncbi:CrcB protein [Nonlabens spongiae]|uniref:Fluoride-specific ion channel FluC n=1 Tax=Nonlabens spongiae TaxID=331648 RepID=A0A1W6MNX9_9FLAO|nr:CrcB protein [Nonlabens spongiae]